MPIPECHSPECVQNRSKGKLHLHSRASRFIKYQELKIQELPEDVPVGNIPRSMTVVCKGDISREVKAGEVVEIGGIFLPTPFTGFAAIKAGLTQDTYLDAQAVTCVKRSESANLDAETEKLIEEMSQMDPYTLLSRSIAPEIFGLEDVKKVLLLQLVGGESRQQGDGMRTRGDINVCLMGDPGVAKSQLLKHITKIAPRCVYTTGKGSSGVGLTATVKRDPMTNELMLEGGALVLADMGICCALPLRTCTRRRRRW
jgi:DNA replication licensing factor MCM7